MTECKCGLRPSCDCEAFGEVGTLRGDLQGKGRDMTLRERIADWISGGALTRARSAHDMALNIARIRSEDRAAALAMVDKAVSSLHRIADMETSNANATVRRMAAEARRGRGSD